jgi:hypothetical protein
MTVAGSRAGRGTRFVACCALLAAALALATLVFGWWGVPLTAALWGALVRGRPGAAGAAAVGAAGAWGALLARAALAAPPTASLAATLGGLLRVPAPALLAVTLLYPALLAWGAATVAGAALRPRRAAAGVAEATRAASTA